MFLLWAVIWRHVNVQSQTYRHEHYHLVLGPMCEFFFFSSFCVHVTVVEASAANVPKIVLLCLVWFFVEQAMAEQLAENDHSAWAKRKKWELEGRGTASRFKLIICPSSDLLFNLSPSADQLTKVYLYQEVEVNRWSFLMTPWPPRRRPNLESGPKTSSSSFISMGTPCGGEYRARPRLWKSDWEKVHDSMHVGENGDKAPSLTLTQQLNYIF